MKRDRDRGKKEAAAPAPAATDKSKMWTEAPPLPDVGMDELLEVLGYKVKPSDMTDVAEKLKQLEMAMGTSTEDGSTAHYNPSDLSGWVGNRLTGFNNYDMIDPTQIQIPGESSSSNNIPIKQDISDDDLRAIPGSAIFSNNNDSSFDVLNSNFNKRMKLPSSSSSISSPPRSMVLVDSQETGVRLVHTLIACAEAIQKDNLNLADALVKHIGILAVSQIGAMRKVATYFAEALARKIYNIYPNDPLQSSYSDVLLMHFYETGPYLKFAHFTANQAILEAFGDASEVHVIDFSLKQGMQWPALMQALALRPIGPPSFRLTGIGPPQPDNNDVLQEVGWKLARLAEEIGIEFEFRGFVANTLSDLDVNVFQIRPNEVVAVNSVFELHRLLARPGSIETVLTLVKGLNPRLVTIVEQEANHNGGLFLERFNESLHYYSSMFDSLESVGLSQPGNRDLVMTEVYLGWQICNVVACEGVDRVERHESLVNWRVRMDSAGFEPVHLGSNAFRQASTLLALFAGGDGYKVEENDGSLMLGWHTRPLIATSAWQLKAAE